MASTTTIQWDASPGNTSFDVEYKKSTSSTWLTVPGSPTSSTSLNVTVEEGTSYDFRVIGHCGSETTSALSGTDVSLCKAPTSLIPTPNITSVSLSWTTQQEHISYTVSYKKSSDLSFIPAPGSPVTNSYPANGVLNITGLDEGISYDFRVSTNCLDATSTFIQVTSTTTSPIWIRDEYVCEQDTLFNLDDSFTNFSSPQGIFWDETSQRFYVVDLDDVSGNLWYFDPDTFTGTSDRTYVSGTAVTGQFIQSYDYSPSLRKIFMSGPSSGGILIYNIGADSVSTISQGSDGAFSRLFTKILNGNLYVTNSADGTIAIIDPVAESVTSTILVATIPGNTTNKYFNNSYNIHAIGNELWVCAGNYRSLNGSIARYNSDFSTFLGEITIPAVVSPGSGAWASGYWQSQFYDEANNKFYLTDVGSKKVTVVSTTTYSVISQTDITNLQGKSFAFVSHELNELTGELYASKTAMNDPNDGSPIVKFYKVDRSNYTYTDMYLNSTVSNLKLRSGSNEFWSVSAGLYGWAPGPPAGWDTDGIVYKYTI